MAHIQNEWRIYGVMARLKGKKTILQYKKTESKRTNDFFKHRQIIVSLRKQTN